MIRRCCYRVRMCNACSITHVYVESTHLATRLDAQAQIKLAFAKTKFLPGRGLALALLLKQGESQIVTRTREN